MKRKKQRDGRIRGKRMTVENEGRVQLRRKEEKARSEGGKRNTSEKVG